MLHPSTKRLIDKLSDMTRKQRVTWTEGENASVVHDTEGYRVVLTAEPHSVLLTDAVGREIETCTPEEFVGEADAQGRPYTTFVAELYREAHRHARGTEKAIRTLLAELDAVEADAPFVERRGVTMTPVAPALDAPDPTTDETAPIESETAITAAVANLADQINGHSRAAEAETETVEAQSASEPSPEPAHEPAPADEPVVASPVAEPEAVAQPALEPEPVAEVVADTPAPSADVAPLEQEPGSFGTFGAFQHSSVDASEPAADTPTEPVAEPDAAQEPAWASAEPTIEPPPVPAPAVATPTLAKPISLSSIPFGFGLGATQRPGAPSHPAISTPDPYVPPVTETGGQPVIDGTLDLPESDLSGHEAIAAAEPYPPVPPNTGPADLPSEPASAAPEPGQPRRFNPWN